MASAKGKRGARAQLPKPVNGTAYSVTQLRHVLEYVRRLEIVAASSRQFLAALAEPGVDPHEQHQDLIAALNLLDEHTA